MRTGDVLTRLWRDELALYWSTPHLMPHGDVERRLRAALYLLMAEPRIWMIARSKIYYGLNAVAWDEIRRAARDRAELIFVHTAEALYMGNGTLDIASLASLNAVHLETLSEALRLYRQGWLEACLEDDPQALDTAVEGRARGRGRTVNARRGAGRSSGPCASRTGASLMVPDRAIHARKRAGVR